MSEPTPKSRAAQILRILHLVEKNACADGGITSTTVEGSVCFHRPVVGNASNVTGALRSAINEFRKGEIFRWLYCVEVLDRDGQLVNFHVSLNDESNKVLDIWHLDPSNGLHTHDVVDGKKQDAHIPFKGDIGTVIVQIAEKIKGALR